MHGALSVAALTLAVAVAVPAGQGGESASISGHVKLTRTRGTPLPSNIYQPRAVGNRSAELPPEIKSVVVYLAGVTFRGALPVSHPAIRQEHEEFMPRVVAITRGSTVDFPNADMIFHNVFSLSGAATFDLGRFPKGQSRSATFTKAGLVKVYCHLHSHMSASILVLDHPYFAIPDLDGSFTLPTVPRGTYKVVGWHERVGERSAIVEVQAGRSASVELVLPVEDSR